MQKIDFRNSNKFFPKINAIFRPKQPVHIKELHIQQDETSILDRSSCNLTNAIIIDNKYTFSTPVDKLNIMGAYYESINSPRYLNNDTRLKEIVDTSVLNLKQDFTSFREQGRTITQFSANNTAICPSLSNDVLHPFCNPSAVAFILKRLLKKSSSGLAGIPPIIPKYLPINIIMNLTILFNNAINYSYFPKCWKCAKVLPILKKGKSPSDPSSYRPISLTLSISKVFEAVVNDKITSFCSVNRIIPDQQFGFKHQHATTHAVHKLLSDLNLKVGNSYLVGAALPDIEKAFDSIWLNGLIYKLHMKNFPLWLLNLIWDMISNKSFFIWDGDSLSSTEFLIKEGLQQGTVNSPIQFNLYLSDLPNLIQNEQGNAGFLAFADDVIVYVAENTVNLVQNKLDSLVDIINRYYMSWNLRLNPHKCETILFRKPVNKLSTKAKAGNNDFQISATIPGTANLSLIPHKKVVKYLGVHLDYLLRGNAHIDYQLKKPNKAFLANSRLFYNKYLTHKSKIILYMLLIRPIITYAAPLL